MSGGSWDYFYSRLDDVASRLQTSGVPLRIAFGSHLQKCAKALHDIEWVDSGDCGEGDDTKAIMSALGKDGPTLVLNEVQKRVEQSLNELQAALKNLPK